VAPLHEQLRQVPADTPGADDADLHVSTSANSNARQRTR